MLVRKNDPSEKQFNFMMLYFERGETADQEDIELLKKQSEDE